MDVAPAPISMDAKERISCVADCINEDGKSWNTHIISLCFSEEDGKAILQTPLSLFHAQDKRYRSLTKDGMYTVKSGYWMGLLGTHT